MGYPDYDIWVIGELEHAADESLEYSHDLALTIREHRLAWMADHSHVIPFEAFGRYLNDCALADAANPPIPAPEIPQELLAGLDIQNGHLIPHGDTRP